MSVPRRVVTLIVVAAWLCPKAYAPIFDEYPGLPSLIQEAEVIAAVTILERLSEQDIGGSARYKIRFDKVLKGNASEKQAVASLRRLEIMPEPGVPEAHMQPTASPQPPGPTRYFALDAFDRFRVQSRWIAFLTRTKADKDVAYKNVNCEGSTFPLSPLRNWTA